MKVKKNKFLYFLFFSTCIHLTVFYFIQKNSLWFYSPIKDLKAPKSHQVKLQKKDKEKILKQFIEAIPANISQKKVVKKIETQSDLLSFNQKILDEKNIKDPNLDIPQIKYEGNLLEKNKNLLTSVDLLSNKAEIHLKELKTKTNFSPSKDVATSAKNIKCEKEKEQNFSFKKLLSYSKIEKLAQKDQILHPNNVDLPTSLLKKDFAPFSIQKDLAKKISFSTLKDLKTYLYEDDFEMEISHVPSKEGGYIFAITLIPKRDIDLPRIPQHFTLLIDRSNSIQSNRLKASRDAIYQAISFLKEDDSFNIIAFDNKMEKLFPAKKRLSEDTKKSARKFLINLRLGSFFTSSNIYNPLYTSIYDNLNKEHVHSIILISNGEGLTSKTLQRHFMGQWTGFNAGRASLFTISMEHDNQLADLEVISTLNRGWAVTSNTKGGLRRKVMKLMKTIQNPIIKDVEFSCISTSGNSFEFFKPHKGLSHLYIEKPYVVIGKCKKLEDFTLVIQGKNRENWVNIKKKISLKSSKRADHILLEQWALHNAWNQYANYLNKQDSSYLEKARKILEPFDIPQAFK